MNNEKILKKIYKTISENRDEDDFEVMLVSAEESGLETMVLTTLHHGFGMDAGLAEGEFYFDEDTFIARVLLVPELDPDIIPELCILISLVNATTQAGCFEYDEYENALAYSLKTPIVKGLSEKEMAELCDRLVAVALSVSEQNCRGLMEFAISGRRI
ncbi:MAG: hypothetical protein K6A72_02650 [Lachnospiraceae bacterium]|nr:hypothetical protein [Lachnospiraceae bacterium]